MNPEIVFSRIDLPISNSIALQVLTDTHLGRLVRDCPAVSIKHLRQRVDQAISSAHSTSKLPPVESFALHRELVKGLPAEAMFIAIAMAFDTVQEGLAFFGLSKNLSHLRIGRHLDPGECEKALRVGRIVLLAAYVLNSAAEARTYLKAPNFALGGAAPRDLLMTAVGAELVLNELQTQADCGPI